MQSGSNANGQISYLLLIKLRHYHDICVHFVRFRFHLAHPEYLAYQGLFDTILDLQYKVVLSGSR